MSKAVFAAAELAAGLTLAAGDVHAQAGFLSHRTNLDPITLASGKPLAKLLAQYTDEMSFLFDQLGLTAPKAPTP